MQKIRQVFQSEYGGVLRSEGVALFSIPRLYDVPILEVYLVDVSPDVIVNASKSAGRGRLESWLRLRFACRSTMLWVGLAEMRLRNESLGFRNGRYVSWSSRPTGGPGRRVCVSFSDGQLWL